MYKQEFKTCIYACYVLGNHFKHIKDIINTRLRSYVSDKLLIKYLNELNSRSSEANSVEYEKPDYHYKEYLAENWTDVWNNFLKFLNIKKRYNIYNKEITLMSCMEKQFKINKSVNNNIKLYVENTLNHKKFNSKLDNLKNIDYFDFIFYEETT